MAAPPRARDRRARPHRRSSRRKSRLPSLPRAAARARTTTSMRCSTSSPGPSPRRDNARPGARAHGGCGAGNAATASLADALRTPFAACWSPIPGAPNPADQIVTFTLQLNQRRHRGAGAGADPGRQQLYGGGGWRPDAPSMAASPIYAAAQSAYNEWREFSVALRSTPNAATIGCNIASPGRFTRLREHGDR